MNLVFELPFYSPVVGGITETIRLAQALNAHVRFQRKSTYQVPLDLGIEFSFGLPNQLFPKCDACITYSDTPYMDMLVRNRNVGRVLVYMLSWGMSPDNERYNAMHKEVTALCSTKKIEDAIHKEGGTVKRIGFALQMEQMYDMCLERKDMLALYYHPAPAKQYDVAIKVSDNLFGNSYIDHVISFGSLENYNQHKKPAGLVGHYKNATKQEIRDIFNVAKFFVMPSKSEGLNLTPVESTLCGCPAVIVDGAIGELFIDGETCIIAKSGSYYDVLESTYKLINNIDEYKEKFRDNLNEIAKEYTMDKLVANVKDVLI